MRIRTALLFGLVVSAAATSPLAPVLAASAACSGASLTELRMTECLAPTTRGIRPASPTPPVGSTPGSASGSAQPGAARPGGLLAAPPPVASSGTSQGTAGGQAGGQAGIDLEIKFAFGSAALSSDAKVVLQRLAHVLSAGELASRRVKVVGHTDAAGSDELNNTLSVARAQAVSAYLAEQGVAGRRLEASGVGKSEQKNPQDPLAAENRRVEIVPAG